MSAHLHLLRAKAEIAVLARLLDADETVPPVVKSLVATAMQEVTEAHEIACRIAEGIPTRIAFGPTDTAKLRAAMRRNRQLSADLLAWNEARDSSAERVEVAHGARGEVRDVESAALAERDLGSGNPIADLQSEGVGGIFSHPASVEQQDGPADEATR